MRKSRITELERLADQTQLVCPFPYDNPLRNEKIFYNFCRDYGESLGISITEEKFGYWTWKKMQAKTVIEDIIWSKDQLPIDLINLLGTPLDFFIVPLVGMTPYCESLGNRIKILLPKYLALLDIFYSLKNCSSKAHEYMHAYNRICAWDLLKRNVLRNSSSFFCSVEPESKIPTYEELKDYERKFLVKMVKSERRWIQKITRN